MRVVQPPEAHVRAARVAQPAPYRPTVRFDSFGAGEADERVAAEALTAHHRLEQVGEGRVRELEVKRHRRVKVRARFRDDRDARETLGGERLELDLGHNAARRARMSLITA